MVLSVNFVVLGKQDLASEFGKKGTETDLSLYDRKESDVIKTWVTPSGFPDKNSFFFFNESSAIICSPVNLSNLST